MISSLAHKEANPSAQRPMSMTLPSSPGFDIFDFDKMIYKNNCGTYSENYSEKGSEKVASKKSKKLGKKAERKNNKYPDHMIPNLFLPTNN